MKVKNRKSFLAAFPQTDSDYGTGGGCTAFYVPLSRNRYVLITDGDANAPTDDDKKVSFGAYDDSDDSYSEPIFGEPDLISWERAAMVIRFLAGEHPPVRSIWLINTFRTWTAAEGLPEDMDADDLLHAKDAPKLTVPQRDWLTEFARLWDAAI